MSIGKSFNSSRFLIMIIGLLLIAIIGLIIYIYYLKKQTLEVVQINTDNQRKNAEIEKEIAHNREVLSNIKNNITFENDILSSLLKSQEEMRESAQKQADEAYQARVSALVKSYKEKEQELSLTFDAKNQDLLKKISIEAGKLADLQAKQLSYIQAKQRQEEIDSNQDYYRLALDEIDINDITLLRELQPRFVKKESIDKLIWEVYYKPAYDILMAHLFPKAAKYCGIYRITDLTTGKSYIGQSVDIKERFRQHIKSALTYGKVTNKLYSAMQKSGVHNFVFEVLEEVTRDKLNERETYWIEFYKTKELGLNGTKGGA